jgi:hypothetical protein
VIDFDVEKAGLWKKASLLLKLKGEVSRIAAARPDLAMTIGTPATLYTKDKIISAGVPLVFSACRSPLGQVQASHGSRPRLHGLDHLHEPERRPPERKVLGKTSNRRRTLDE